MAHQTEPAGAPGAHCGHWMTAERVRICSRALLIAHIVVAIAYIIFELAGGGEVLFGNDFRVFWSASKLGLDGHGIDAYEIDKLFEVQRAVTPSLQAPHPWQYWFYPPMALLFVAPLAIVPYFLSFLLFNAAGILFYLYVLRAITARKGAVVLALAFPAVLFAAVNGQNSFFTAGFAGLALVLLDRRPALAGVLIGLLAIKPQLAVLFVVALVCAKRWDVLRVAACTALALLLLSLALFSPASGVAFINNVTLAKSFAENGLLPLNKMPTVFASARLIGLSPDVANGLHLGVALAATLAVASIWSRRSAPYLRNSALVLGTLLFSPHLFDYDLVWLAWPIAWLAVNGIENGWRQGERELLLLAWFSPTLGGALSHLTVQAAPLICLALLALITWRCRQATGLRPDSFLRDGTNHGN